MRKASITIHPIFWQFLPWLVLALSLLFVLITVRHVESIHRERQWERFRMESGRLATDIQNSISNHLLLIDSLRGLVAVQNSISQKEFRDYTGELNLNTRYPAIQRLGVALRMRPDGNTQWRRLLDPASQTNFSVWPDTGRGERLPIFYSEPDVPANRAVIGYDLWADPLRSEAARVAVETGELAITAPVPIMPLSNIGETDGFTVYAPVYFKHIKALSSNERWTNFVCLIFCTFRSDSFMASSLNPESRQLISVSIHHGATPGPGARLQAISGSLPQDLSSVRYVATNTVKVANATWTLTTYSKPPFEASASVNPSRYLLTGGVLFSLFLFGFSFWQSRAHLQSRVHVRLLMQAADQLQSKDQALTRSQRLAKLGSWEWDIARDNLSWSDETFAIFGLSPNHFTPSYQAFMELVHPDDRAAVKAAVEGSIATHEPYHCEYRIITPADGVKTVVGQAEIVCDGSGKAIRMLGAVQDVTERKHAENASEENLTRLALAVKASGIGFWDWELQTGKVYFSDEVGKQLGLNAGELGSDISALYDLLHEEDRAKVKAGLEELATGNTSGFIPEFRLRHKNGTYRWVFTRAEMVRDQSGRPNRLLGCQIDLTDRKEAAEQLRQGQKMQAVGQLAGGVAHDFNNLLTVIHGHCELALESSAPELRDSLTEIQRSAERASQLTRQLLLFSRQQPMQLNNIDLATVINGTVKMLRRLIGENIRLVVHPTASRPPLIVGDVGMMEQVLVNLAVNARDAMPEGGTLEIITGVCRFEPNPDRGRAGGTYVTLAVQDNGCGMTEETRSRIFEPFFTTKPEGKGTGLGLATVHGIMKQHGGWVDVQSSAGKGSRFTLYFPATAATAVPTAGQPEKTSPRTGKETVLLVEDEAPLRNLMRRVLQNMGHTVLLAEDGDTAKAVWSQNRNTIDLVITDMVMPGKATGWHLVRQFQSDRPSLKAIIMSGYTGSLAEREWEREFSGQFLQKPFTVVELENCLAAAFDKA